MPARGSASKKSGSKPPSASSFADLGSGDLLAAMALFGRPLPMAWVDSFRTPSESIDRLVAEKRVLETSDGLALAQDHPELETLPWSERRRLHLLLAELCQRPPLRLELAGKHFEAAGRDADAAQAYLAAADAHCRRHHHQAAIRTYLTAFRLLPADTPEDLVVNALRSFSRCASMAGEISDAVAELRHRLSEPPWSAITAVRIETNLALAALLARELRHVESAQARRAAARDLAALGRDAEAAEASLAAASALAFASRLALAHEAADAAVHAANRVESPELRAHAAITRGVVLGMLGRTSEGIAELERAVDLALRHKLNGAAAEAYRFLGTVREYASLYQDEQTAFASALKFCRTYGQTTTAGYCLGCLSYSYLRSGDWKRSEETARGVLSDRKIPSVSRLVAQSVLGLLHTHRGEMRTARRLLSESLEGCRRSGLLVMDFFNLPGLAMLEETAGATAEASRLWLEFTDFWRSTDDRHDAIPGLSGAAIFFSEHQQKLEAASAAEALDRIAALTGNPEAAGAAHAAAAELLLLEDRADRAVAELERAKQAFDQRVLSIEPIRVRLRLAVALRRKGLPNEARTNLKEAERVSKRLGARTWTARIDALLQAQSVLSEREKSRPQRRQSANGQTGWELLSTRQREIARLLVDGQTNKQMASALSLSVRTVDMHVAHVLARMDCQSRAQAAGKIAAALA